MLELGIVLCMSCAACPEGLLLFSNNGLNGLFPSPVLVLEVLVPIEVVGDYFCRLFTFHGSRLVMS